MKPRKTIEFNNTVLPKDKIILDFPLVVPVHFFNYSAPSNKIEDLIDISLEFDSIQLQDEILVWLDESNIKIEGFIVVLSNFYKETIASIISENLIFTLYFKSDADLLAFKLRWL